MLDNVLSPKVRSLAGKQCQDDALKAKLFNVSNLSLYKDKYLTGPRNMKLGENIPFMMQTPTKKGF